uniref:glucuronosyltransferase n=1 Tax=Meloidogyne javanica TaxID=6303 RepID=A0A915MM58_MELJA
MWAYRFSAYDQIEFHVGIASEAICDWLNFFRDLNIANVLCYNGKYDVYLLVVKFEGNVISKKPLEDVHLIEVTYIEDKEYSQVLNKGGVEMNWTVEDKKDDDHIIKLLGFYMYFTYKAIIENPKVEIYGIPQRIFDWLKLMGQQFALGIAEFSLSGGAFPLFEEIGLKKYIAATSTIPFPIHLHFFGQELYYLMPVEEMPKMWDLLRKSKYYLINVHPLGQFPFPSIPKRIVNIGGIEVEIEGILNEIEEEKRLEEEQKNKGSITGYLKNKALYVGVPLILIPFTFKQKFNAKIAEYMRLGITVDHTKFVEEFPLAVKKLMREDQHPTNILVENANKVKEAIEQFPNEQIKTLLETVEKAIEDKDKEGPFPKMRKFEEDSLLYFGHKPFSVVLEEFVNSKQK